MKTRELIIAFKEQLCKLWIDKDKLYVCINVVKITQLVYKSSCKRKNVLLGSISAQSMASYLPVRHVEIRTAKSTYKLKADIHTEWNRSGIKFEKRLLGLPHSMPCLSPNALDGIQGFLQHNPGVCYT